MHELEFCGLAALYITFFERIFVATISVAFLFVFLIFLRSSRPCTADTDKMSSEHLWLTSRLEKKNQKQNKKNNKKDTRKQIVKTNN